jgi:hypothetical protein
VFLIAAAVEAGFLFYRLRLKRQVTRATEKAALADREVANEKRVLLAKLKHNLEPELFTSITNAFNT